MREGTSPFLMLGPRYEELGEELRREASLGGDETGWRIKGKNPGSGPSSGSVASSTRSKSGEKEVPQRVLGKDCGGL